MDKKLGLKNISVPPNKKILGSAKQIIDTWMLNNEELENLLLSKISIWMNNNVIGYARSMILTMDSSINYNKEPHLHRHQQLNHRDISFYFTPTCTKLSFDYWISDNEFDEKLVNFTNSIPLITEINNRNLTQQNIIVDNSQIIIFDPSKIPHGARLLSDGFGIFLLFVDCKMKKEFPLVSLEKL